MILGAYGLVARLSGLLVPWILERRARLGKEDPARLGERLGTAGRKRPSGPLLWIHGASVGESVSALGLIKRLLSLDAALHILITSGTVTSARLLEDRLPPRVIHQYTPVDTPVAVRRFLDHWRPDAAVWLESELWPNLVLETRRFGVAMLLLNARMSRRSYRRWRWAPGMIRLMLSCFDCCLVQSKEEAQRFGILGALKVGEMENLKWMAPPPPAQSADDLHSHIAGRPVWLAASTHHGEEEIVAAAHRRLKADFPAILTMIAPRHPDRGAAIAGSLSQSGLRVARRSLGECPRPDHEIYLADTLGELGLFYQRAAIAFVGGSLVKSGGHNPIEAAQCGCALVMGPHTENFLSVTAVFEAEGSLQRVDDAESLALAVGHLFGNDAARQTAIEANYQVVAARSDLLDPVIDQITAYLPHSFLGNKDASA